MPNLIIDNPMKKDLTELLEQIASVPDFFGVELTSIMTLMH
jgi:hypothetical protein